jgi:ABC-type glycerol-3-phosphate transport system permease component
MPIISKLGRHSWSGRLLTIAMYVILSVLSVTMVTPFLITAMSSICNDYDYQRFRPVPRFLLSRTDRYVKGIVPFLNGYPRWSEQLATHFDHVPSHWSSWSVIGRDVQIVDEFARRYLEDHPEGWKVDRNLMAADYADFSALYPVVDQLVTVADLDAAHFLAERYQTLWVKANPDLATQLRGEDRYNAVLQLLSETWGVPLPNFHLLGFSQSEMRQPYWQQSWFPTLESARYQDFLLVKKAAAYHVFTPGMDSRWRRWARAYSERGPPPALVELVESPDPYWEDLFARFKREVAPATPLQPYALRALWRQYLASDEVVSSLDAATAGRFDVGVYNKLGGTAYTHLNQIPFPLPEDSPEALSSLWDQFVRTRYPVRLTTIERLDEALPAYHAFLRERFRTVASANRLLGAEASAWEDYPLARTAPVGPGTDAMRAVWIDFVKGSPTAWRGLHSSERAYQDFLRERYGTLDAVNASYGTEWKRFEEAFPPFDQAYTVTVEQAEWALSLLPALSNYRFITTFLLGHSRALLVTILLVSLSILATLTINPMAAYALSRFSLRGKEKVILFLVATMAFPAMVSAIPAYLLMRDLGLLNTYFALVLPSAANGMAIFILKGFFDSMPKELYEAATIDGAKEWQIFLVITMPMMKPILAINALGAFMGAYNGWEWALIICQDSDMWTLAVWMYQASQWWTANTPWIVMAGFVVVSIPTLIVFMFCQRIIMRGIIIPQMK